MKLPRRNFLHLAAGAAALPAVTRIARAQAYPTRPVRIIVGFPAGFLADTVARLIAQSLSDSLRQQFVVENRPGASSNIATDAVVRAPPDGYSLLLVTQTNATNATLYENLGFNFIRDIAPEHIRTGKLRALAVTPATRVDVLPDIPALGEFVSGYEASGFTGIGAPKSTSAEIIETLNKAINAALTDPKMKARFANLGVVPLANSPAEFGKYIVQYTEKWGKVIQAANIKPE
jgi:tripartite-type tricarboxylate transporter receptor subunit TctC